jgi:hypothetical protein
MRRTTLAALALGLSVSAAAALPAQTGTATGVPVPPVRRSEARVPGPARPAPSTGALPGDSVLALRSEDAARDIRKDRHVVHQDALKVRRAEDRIAALERRVSRDRATLERDQKAGRTAHLAEDRESLKQAQGALAAERGRLARSLSHN